MDPGTHERILSSGEVKRFSSCRDIPLSAYWFGPDIFILACHCYSKEQPKMFIGFLKQTNPKPKYPLFIHIE
jgi:hypothetical protein